MPGRQQLRIKVEPEEQAGQVHLRCHLHGQAHGPARQAEQVAGRQLGPQLTEQPQRVLEVGVAARRLDLDGLQRAFEYTFAGRDDAGDGAGGGGTDLHQRVFHFPDH